MFKAGICITTFYKIRLNRIDQILHCFIQLGYICLQIVSFLYSLIQMDQMINCSV